MKHHIGITIDGSLFRELEEARGREKRSTFYEHLLKLGFRAHKQKEKLKDQKLEAGIR